MSERNRVILLAAGLVLACGLLVAAAAIGLGAFGLVAGPIAPTPDFGGTLQALVAASTASGASGASTAVPSLTPAASLDQPVGHIVLTCQIYKEISMEQICIMNADGSGYRRLTTEDGVRHFYPSLAPDGRSVVYSAYREDNVYELYELTLADGVAKRLTDRLGILVAPEISPDGKLIVFTRGSATSDLSYVWLMNRDGSKPHRLISIPSWDPTWSPDGRQILFASSMDGSNQLYVINLDGSGLRKVTSLPALRGRSDWSSQGQIVTYSGDSWKRELFLMSADGSGLHQVSPAGGNSQGPSFSPDGFWITFTAYFDHMREDNGCEIYIIRTDGTDLRRLTDNDYCDYQPRWGP